MATIERQQGSMDQGRMPITQLEFNQAMRDFKTMFPEMDEDVIEVVLRSNNGEVDVTIDQLLAMSVDSEQEKLRSEMETSVNYNDEVPPKYSPPTPPPSYQQAVPCTPSPTKLSNLNKMISPTKRTNIHLSPSSMDKLCDLSLNLHKDPLRAKFKWNPPLIGELPISFLRFDNFDENRRKSLTLSKRKSDMSVLSSALLQQKMEENERQRKLSLLSKDTVDPEAAQYLEDERIAIYLQNEEFVQELRRNKEFISTLKLDSEAHSLGLGAEGLPDGPVVPSHHDDAAFRETLKNMGKASRRKFAQLARLFFRRKRRSFHHLLGHNDHHGGNPSRDNLLGSDDNYTELENEGSDSEEQKSNNFSTHSSENGFSTSYVRHSRNAAQL